MNVRELLEQLAGVDPNREVVLSIDEEGNGYHPARVLGVVDFFADDQNMDSEAARQPCVVLWP